MQDAGLHRAFSKRLVSIVLLYTRSSSHPSVDVQENATADQQTRNFRLVSQHSNVWHRIDIILRIRILHIGIPNLDLIKIHVVEGSHIQRYDPLALLYRLLSGDDHVRTANWTEASHVAEILVALHGIS